MNEAAENSKVSIERLTVLPDRIEARVRCDASCRKTNPQMIGFVLQEFPTLPYHTCRNKKGPTFLSVMDNTSVPHLLEHLVIDLQTRALAEGGDALKEAGAPISVHAKSALPANATRETIFTGTTQWSADDENVAIVRVSFLDDIVALGAFKEALNFINRIL